ncbi:MAG TPA: DUF6580 family putative transport protein [Gemmataceae bacterium]|nr:DUF6580 family putative transport protein [Gemmataceae bacterium]
MNMKSMNGPEQSKEIGRPLAGTLAVAVGLLRLVPHAWNFTPSEAMEIFSGARLRTWHAFAIPLAVRLVTDLLLLPIQGLVASFSLYVSFLPFVYLSIIFNVLLGRLLCRTKSPWKIGTVVLLGSVQFFLLTNFGSWIGSNMYPHTAAGLISAYWMGLPFFGSTLVGCFAYAAVLFGADAWLASRQRAVKTVAAPATYAAEVPACA